MNVYFWHEHIFFSFCFRLEALERNCSRASGSLITIDLASRLLENIQGLLRDIRRQANPAAPCASLVVY